MIEITTFSLYKKSCIIFAQFHNLRNFFSLVLKKQSIVTKFGYFFAKRLRTTLRMFLDNRSKRFANTSQNFFDKRGFQKLDKNQKKFICIWRN